MIRTTIRLLPVLVALLLLACGDATLSGPGEPRPAAPTDELDEPGQQTPTPPREEPTAQPVEEPSEPEPVVTHALIFDVDAETTMAGERVAYTVQVLEDGVDVTGDWAVEVTVTPDTGVNLLPGTVTFTVPGTYALEATATGAGQVLREDAQVTVTNGTAETLSVQAELDVYRAGELVRFTVELTDPFGNSVDFDEAGLNLWLEPTGQAIDLTELSVVLTEADRYEVHATTANDLQAADIFQVSPTAPDSLVMTLAPYDDLDPGDSVEYTLDVADRYGNTIESPAVTVTTDPSAGTIVDARRIIFEEEGTYQVSAVIEGSDLHDEAGPIVVDGFGPLIDIKSPERGTYQSDNPVVVHGSVFDTVTGVAGVELNGEPVTLDSRGDFQVELTPRWGVNLIELVAWDAEGHETNAVQSYFYGPAFVDSGNRAYTSLGARVNEGTLNLLEGWVVDEFDADYLRSLVLANSRIWSGCVDLGIYEPCAWVDATNFTMSYLTIDLDPRTGRVDLYAGIRNPNIRIHLNGDWPVPSIWGNVKANWANLTGRLSLWVDASGNIRASLTNIDVSLPGFWIQVSGWPDFLDFVLGWISDWVRSDVEDAIAKAIRDQAPQAIDSALSELEIAQDIDVLGVTMSVDAIPQRFDLDEEGITLVLSTIVEPDWIAEGYDESPGALRTASSLPSYGTTPGFVLSVSDDFVNQALFAIWQSGALADLLVSQVDTIDTSFLSMLLPEATGLEFEFDPLLPPTFRPSLPIIIPPVVFTRDGADDGPTVGTLQVGDLLIDMYATFPRGERQLVARVAVTMFASTRLGISADNTVTIGFSGDPTFYFDGVMSTLPNLTEDDLENVLSGLLPVVLPQLTEGVQEFPLPAFQGFRIASPDVILSGPSLDFLNVQGNLTTQ